MKDETIKSEATSYTPEKPAFSVVSTPLLTELEQRATKAAELQDQLLRKAADWENARKRLQREKEEAIKYAAESLLEQLLPVVDNFELGLAATQTSTDTKSIAQGMQMVFIQLNQFFREAGVETIDAIGKPFDPHLHEAIGQQESSDVPEGTILSQTRKGYKLKDRLMRPAAVYVAKSPEEKAAE